MPPTRRAPARRTPATTTPLSSSISPSPTTPPYTFGSTLPPDFAPELRTQIKTLMSDPRARLIRSYEYHCTLRTTIFKLMDGVRKEVEEGNQGATQRWECLHQGWEFMNRTVGEEWQEMVAVWGVVPKVEDGGKEGREGKKRSKEEGEGRMKQAKRDAGMKGREEEEGKMETATREAVRRMEMTEKVRRKQIMEREEEKMFEEWGAGMERLEADPSFVVIRG